MTRPSWTDYFLGIATIVSQRSHDIHTKHGCVITDQNHRILGVGYNGFARGLCDNSLPLSRPEKYAWMIHAEKNALSNCVVRPDNGIAYVTGQCCCDCIMSLWQEGITKVYMSKNHGTQLFDAEAKKIFDKFIEMSGMQIDYVEPNLNWIKDMAGVI